MKKSLKALALIGILGAAIWLGGSRRVEGNGPPICESLQGGACSPEGASKICRYADTTFFGVCECWDGTWHC